MMIDQTLPEQSRRDASTAPPPAPVGEPHEPPRATVLGTLAELTRGPDINADTDAGFAGSNFP